MNLFYFGKEPRRLFGTFHPPASGKPARAGVVLAAPFGHEAIRVHRFYRLLAERLSRQEIAVLRFDYYGTGDSAGTDEDANLDGWASDLCEAHRELQRRIGGHPTTWLAVRLGAIAALRAAPQSFPRVQRLVLWDPIVDGSAYLAELGVAQVEELELAHCIPDPGWRRAIKRDPLALSAESLGFVIPSQLHAQILSLHPGEPAPAPSCPLTVISRANDEATRQWCDATSAAHPQARLSRQSFEHSLIWTSNPFANNEVAPASALQYLLNELS